MAQSMDIQIIGDNKGVQAMLRHFDTALNPLAIAAFLGAVVDPYLRHQAEDRFKNEGDAVVGKWVPLTSATQQIRASQGYGAAGPINRRTDELRDYIVGAPSGMTVHPMGATLDMKPTRPTGKLASKVKVAQKGGKAPSGRTVPARPVAAIGVRDMAFFLTALGTHIKRPTRR